MYVSSVQHGSVHDQTHFYKDDVPKKLRHRYGKKQVKVGNKSYQAAIIGDKAYTKLMVPNNWRVMVTKTGEKHDVFQDMGRGINVKKRKKTADESTEGARSHAESYHDMRRSFLTSFDSDQHVEWRSEVAIHRAVVERVIGAMKSWKCLLNELTVSDLRRCEKLVRVVAALCNCQLITNDSNTW